MKKTPYLLLLAFLCSLSTYAAPTLARTVPADAAVNISTTSKIILQFSEEVVVGSGECQLNGVTLTPTIVTKYVTFTPTPMDNSKTYTFIVPAGAFRNKSGEAFAGTTVTFTTIAKPQPAARLFDAVVAKDGSGNYTSIQKAVDAMPTGRTQPWLVFIKNGVYEELVQIPSTKPNLHLIGQNKDKTVIQYKINASGSTGSALEWQYSANRLGLPSACVVLVEGNDFMAENISFINTWGTEILNGPMALAIHAKADRAVYKNCIMRSFQDTWQTNGRHYVKNCFIEGAVDFIYGGGDCYFDSCTINLARDGSVIVAPAHASEKWGYVFMNCTVTAPKVWSTSLGRPWVNSPRASFVNTKLAKNVSVYPAGWAQMGTIPAVFADYNTMNYLGQPVDLSKRISRYYYTDRNTGLRVEGDAKNTLTSYEVSTMTIRNVLSGSDAWQPDALLETLSAPNAQLTGNTISWKSVPYAICYGILHNDSLLAFTTDSTYALVQDGSYQIQAVNENGGLSPLSNLVVKSTTGLSGLLKPLGMMELKGSSLRISNVIKPAILKQFDLTGRLLQSRLVTENTELSLASVCPSILLLIAENGVQSLKMIP